MNEVKFSFLGVVLCFRLLVFGLWWWKEGVDWEGREGMVDIVSCCCCCIVLVYGWVDVYFFCCCGVFVFGWIEFNGL